MFDLVKIKYDLPTLVLCLVAFSLPWGVVFYNISIAACFIYLIFYQLKNRELYFKTINHSVIYYALFLFFIVVSLLYSENKFQGIINASHYFHFIVWGIILDTFKNKIDVKIILKAFISSVILLGIYVNVSTFIHIIEQNESVLLLITHYNRNFLIQVVPDMMQPMYFSVYILTAWLFLFYIFERNTMIKKAVFLLLTLYFCFLLYILSSKVVAFYLFIFIFLQLSMSLLKKLVFYKRFLISCLSLIVFVFILNLFKAEIITLLFGNQSTIHWHQDFGARLLYFIENGDTSRTDNWNSALKIVKDNLFFGIGIGDVFDILQQYRDKSSWAYIENANTHNQFISIAVATGVVGVIAFLFFIFNLFAASIKTHNYLLLYFTLLFMVFMFVENVFDRHQGVILFGFFTFLLLNFNKSHYKVG